MPFVSEYAPLSIDDAQGVDGGYVPRDFEADPLGEGYAAPFAIPVIPRSEWAERIEEMERTKSRLSDVCKRAGLTPLHQGQTNFCWANGVVHCVEILRVAQGQPMVRLSPASVGGPITRYRNVGGWGSQALKYVAEHGAVPQEQWPANAITSKYDTPETRAARKLYQADEWYDLRPRSFDEEMTCLLLRIPVAIAHNRWRHLVTAVDPVVLPNGRFGRMCHNSGYGRDRNGISVLSEQFGAADEAVAPRVVTGG